MILILYILSIFGGSAGDGLHHRGNKLLAHPLKLLQPVSLLALFILALFARPDYDMDQIVLIGASYFALRFFLFDYIWNLFAGKNIFYIGDTSIYDKALRQINPAMVHLIKLCLGILAIVFLIL